jgi:hypothetical protein
MPGTIVCTMKKISSFVLAFALLAGSMTGCATLVGDLPSIIATINDGSLILSTIESFLQAYFLQNPNPTKQAACEKLIVKAKTALDAAQRAASGVDKINQAEVDTAFQDFKSAYLDLTSLMSSYGIGISVGGSTVKATSGTTIIVPTPLAVLHAK